MEETENLNVGIGISLRWEFRPKHKKSDCGFSKVNIG